MKLTPTHRVVAAGILFFVLMIQNVLLVQKNARLNKGLQIMTDLFHQSNVLQKGDSVGLMPVIGLDGVADTIKPPPPGMHRLLFVFVTWCRTCQDNLAAWNTLAGDMRRAQVEVLGISPDSIPPLRAYSETLPLSFRVVSTAHDTSIAETFRFKTFPLTILIGAGGVVEGVWVGALRSHQVQELMRKAAPTVAVDRNKNKYRRERHEEDGACVALSGFGSFGCWDRSHTLHYAGRAC